MEKNKKYQFIGIGIIVVFIIAFSFYLKNDSALNNSSDKNSKTSTSTIVTKDGVSAVISGDGEVTIEQVPIDYGPVPDLNRLVINDSVSKDAKIVLENRIKEASLSLKNNSINFPLWTSLGLYRKMAGDYLGAKEAWEYACKLEPANYVAFGNLGDLYGYYLKDVKKAEASFLRAISNDPSQIYLYFQIVDFYKNVMKDTTKAKVIVEQGIKNNPNSKDLTDLLSSI